MKNSVASLWGMVVICLGAAIAPLDFSVNIAFPAMTSTFGLDTQAIRWVAICYMLTYGGLMLVFGAMGDKIGHLKVFKFGLWLAFFAFSLCALAPTYPLLLTGRILQGVAVALTLSCAPALVLSLFAEADRTWALSMYGANFSFAAALAPLIGGFATANFGWPGVYWFRVPLVLIVLFSLRYIRFPIKASLAVEHTPIAINQSPPKRKTPSISQVFEMLTKVLGMDKNFLLINASSVVVQWTVFVIPLMVPYYLIQMAEWTAIQCGLVLALWAAGAVFGSLFAQSVVRLSNIARTAYFSAWLHIFGLIMMGFWNEEVFLPLICISMLLNGIGLGIFQVAYADLIVAALPVTSRGVAGSLTQVTRTAGVIIGAFVWLWIFDVFSHSLVASTLEKTQVFIHGFRIMIWISVGVCTVFFLLSATKRGLWFNRDPLCQIVQF